MISVGHSDRYADLAAIPFTTGRNDRGYWRHLRVGPEAGSGTANVWLSDSPIPTFCLRHPSARPSFGTLCDRKSYLSACGIRCQKC